MRLKPIITSLLDNDMYKFSMGQAIYHGFQDEMCGWTIKCRNEGIKFTEEMVEEIREQVQHYCTLRFKEEELDFLSKVVWIHKSYIAFLRKWQPSIGDFEITTNAECGLSIETDGSWMNTSMYETPLLTIVNEVYFRFSNDYDALLEDFECRLDSKIQALADGRYEVGKFSDFGFRRRLSGEAHELVVRKFSSSDLGASSFIGTSCVSFAYKYGLLPVGTMAHEWIMCVGQGNPKHNVAYSNWYALNAWVKEYGTLNGIALTDTITTKVFLRDFRLTFAKLFSGVRHDSGDPFDWGETMLKHYESLGINPKEKTLLFSDSLNFEKATSIYRHFKDRADVAFGIGTYLTNDTYVDALNIVMKPTTCNGRPIAKVSDTEGKGMCKSKEYVDYLKRCIDWRLEYE